VRNAPRYATGTRDWASALGNSNFARLLSANSRIKDNEGNNNTRVIKNNSDNYLSKLLQATLEQNNLLYQLLQKNTDVYINDRVAGRLLEPVITEMQNRNKKIDSSFEPKKV